MTSFVAYYRVSTDGQGRSGLGLDAQRAAVARYVGDASLLSEFTEIESGRKHTNRPQLAAALSECRRKRATLVIATLDRLARNVHFISGLMESGIPFKAADMPDAEPFQLHIFSAMAELEARKISQRTSAALKEVSRELQEKGQRISRAGRIFTSLGNPRWQDSLPRARAARNPNPAPQVVDLMQSHRAQGLTLRAIATQLNGIGLTTPRGRRWHPETVRTTLIRRSQGSQ